MSKIKMNCIDEVCTGNANLIGSDIKSETYRCLSCGLWFKNEKNVKSKVRADIDINTSAKSKEEVESNGVAKTQREKLKEFIKINPNVCIREISDLTKIQKSTICARLNELRDKGIVVQDGYKNYKGKDVMRWRLS